MILCAFLLSSCGFSFGDSKPSETKAAGGSNPALSTPPIAGNRPGNSANDLSQMKPALGVNTNLFGEKIKDEDKRLDRLETAVQSLRNDFDSVSPSINRLISVEGDLQELIGQLETLLEQESAPPPPQRPAPAPMAAPAPTPVAPQGPAMPAQTATATPTNIAPAARPQPIPDPAPVTAPAPAMAGQSIVSIRVGEHPDKTRIVLDASGNPNYSYDLDNSEKIFIVELPGTGWSASAQSTFSSSPVLASYRTDSLNGNGTRLIMQLKKAASVVYSSKIGGKQPGQERIVIDLAPDNSGAATQ